MNMSLSVSVTGPEFQQIKVGVGHRLDVSSSGVLGMIVLQLITQILPVCFSTCFSIIRCFFSTLVLGVGNGNKVLSDLYRTRVTRVTNLCLCKLHRGSE